MRLSGKQIAQIQNVLMVAFSRDDLRAMVRIELDETLELIADGENLRNVVFNLIIWAEQHGRIRDLVYGADNYNHSNLQIHQLVQDLDRWQDAWQASATVSAESGTLPDTRTSTVSKDTAIKSLDEAPLGGKISDELLKILVCPEDKGSLTLVDDGKFLLNPRNGYKYPVRNGIPVMLIDEGKKYRDSNSHESNHLEQR